jgi:hypothetical protein
LTFFGKPHLINWTKFVFVHNAGLLQLSLLDLARNNLAHGAVGINKDTFKRLVRLRELDLTTNKLNRLDSAIFKDLYELQVGEKNFFPRLLMFTLNSTRAIIFCLEAPRSVSRMRSGSFISHSVPTGRLLTLINQR